MAESVLMPKSGISVESCIIGMWHKNIGDEVAVGDVLFDYETDKATFDCESTATGVVLDIFFGAGEEVTVLKPVCAIGSPGEDVSAIRIMALGGDLQTGNEHSVSNDDKHSVSEYSSRKLYTQPDAVAYTSTGASPRAKRLAEKLGVGVQDATPTGPDGRIIARDVDKLYSESGVQAPERASDENDSSDTHYEYSKASASDKPMSGIRRAISTNMLASLHSTAQLTHHHSFDASMLLSLRKAYKSASDKDLTGISIGDMILFAVSRMLEEFSYMNALLLENNIIRTFNSVNLGFAVDTPRGLLVPTIFDADRMSLRQISASVKELSAQARSGRLPPDVMQGATFTVSNLGPTGVEMFTPILNAPQVGILGVCGIVNRFRQGTSGVEVYPSIGLSLTYDHRAIDGAPASRFVQALAKTLENFPALLT